MARARDLAGPEPRLFSFLGHWREQRGRNTCNLCTSLVQFVSRIGQSGGYNQCQLGRRAAGEAPLSGAAILWLGDCGGAR